MYKYIYIQALGNIKWTKISIYSHYTANKKIYVYTVTCIVHFYAVCRCETIPVLLKVYLIQFLSSPDDLISAIHADIKEAQEKLELPENKAYTEDNFFKSTEQKIWWKPHVD